jgi:hypothetical protein
MLCTALPSLAERATYRRSGKTHWWRNLDYELYDHKQDLLWNGNQLLKILRKLHCVTFIGCVCRINLQLIPHMFDAYNNCENAPLRGQLHLRFGFAVWMCVSLSNAFSMLFLSFFIPKITSKTHLPGCVCYRLYFNASWLPTVLNWFNEGDAQYY